MILDKIRKLFKKNTKLEKDLLYIMSIISSARIYFSARMALEPNKEEQEREIAILLTNIGSAFDLMKKKMDEYNIEIEEGELDELEIAKEWQEYVTKENEKNAEIQKDEKRDYSKMFV